MDWLATVMRIVNLVLDMFVGASDKTKAMLAKILASVESGLISEKNKDELTKQREKLEKELKEEQKK